MPFVTHNKNHKFQLKILRIFDEKGGNFIFKSKNPFIKKCEISPLLGVNYSLIHYMIS